MKDNFAYLGLPKEEDQAKIIHLDKPQFSQPELLNCAHRLLDFHIENGQGDAIAIQTFSDKWTYRRVYETANQIARVLIEDYQLVPGNRVLLRSANNPMMVACWFAIIKAGGIVVATMPLLRNRELNTIIECAQISLAICDYNLAEELNLCNSPFLKNKLFFSNGDLEQQFSKKSIQFTNCLTKANDIAIIGFTSGTTGLPKMTAHFHRDILNVCEAFPAYSLQPKTSDIFTGSPPLGFTFGLGGLVLFPFYYGASSFLIEKPSPDLILEAIEKFKITICFTAPTAWRVISTKVERYNIKSLRKCVSAGESLPLKTWETWYEKTGLKIIDGIGATELLHIFISSDEENMKPGALGKPIMGYEAIVIDEEGKELPNETLGRLAIRGITGCKYLYREEKQHEYVKDGWNITGDIFKKDSDGYFCFIARGDDMIISSGYNIAAIEVESVLLTHNDIAECAVVGIPDEERGMIVCAHIVLKDHANATAKMAQDIQNWFKEVAAPYKYPRKILFCESLPKTETGKIQRFKLKNNNYQ